MVTFLQLIVLILNQDYTQTLTSLLDNNNRSCMLVDCYELINNDLWKIYQVESSPPDCHCAETRSVKGKLYTPN